jgi:hypothetical protein
MRPKVHIWINVRRLCTWGIIDFFQRGTPPERKAIISEVRKITGRSLNSILVMLYLIWLAFSAAAAPAFSADAAH